MSNPTRQFPDRHNDVGYDAIVVGARVAGAATALQLARAGQRVLMVDRRRPGGDTLSTHALMRAGVLQLHHWGLLDQVIAAGTTPVRKTTIHYGASADVIPMKPKYGIDALYAPRRTVLDSILVDAAEQAGVEVRFGTTVDDVIRDGSGRVCGIEGRCDGERFEARARFTIGADGTGSSVARAVAAPTLWQGRHRTAVIYGYFEGEVSDGYEWFYRPTATAGLIPTNDGQTCVWIGVPGERFADGMQRDLPGAFTSVFAEAAPEAAQRLRRATPVSRFRGFPGLEGYSRQACGPGWALVGDASHFKDPLSAHGLTDAMRDAEFLSQAIRSVAGGWCEEGEAFAAYGRIRDRLSLDMNRTTDRVASFDWTLDEVRGMLLEINAAMNEEVEDLLSLDIMRAATAA